MRCPGKWVWRPGKSVPMKRHQSGPRGAFSLVEITLSLGVIAICFLAVLGLLPIASTSNRAAAAEGAAASIATAVVADIRATPRTATMSPQFGVPLGSSTTLYFDAEGGSSTTLNARSQYRVTVTFPMNSAGSNAASYAHVKITWPAAATLTNAAGTVAVFGTFSRH
jgi:uncharacterized protein (TIGR02598 family)